VAVPSREKPVVEEKAGKLPLTPAQRAKKALRNQIIFVAVMLIIILTALSVGFVTLILPLSKPNTDDSLLIEARFKKNQKIGDTLNQSLKEAEDTSGDRFDAALQSAYIGRNDPFNDLRPDPLPPEPEWPAIRYAGIIRASNKTYAIIEIGQETFSARPGDVLIGDIVVAKINDSKLTLSYKGFQKEFVLGGESN
jgi:hypothetical protein